MWPARPAAASAGNLARRVAGSLARQGSGGGSVQDPSTFARLPFRKPLAKTARRTRLAVLSKKGAAERSGAIKRPPQRSRRLKPQNRGARSISAGDFEHRFD